MSARNERQQKRNKQRPAIFDPRVVSADETKNDAVVWTSQSVEWALEAIKLGRKISHSPFYEKNPDLRAGNLVFQYSQWEYDELVKCANNIMYFIETYCKVKRPDGKIGVIKLRSYQLQQILDYIENDEVILGWSRQSGKTIGTALYILWCMIFNADKSTALLANKGGTSKEVLDKIKSIYRELPFFMKPGIFGWNTGVMSFDNRCRIFCGPTTMDALNGKTCNILYIDEFAYVGKGRNKIAYQKDFLANAKPVLSSQKDSGLAKLIISSTPVGKEYFYELFDNALRGKNNMKASKVCWWSVPGRDNAWAMKEIATIGLAKFKQQFEMSFDVHAETLLNARTMRRLARQKTAFFSADFDILSNYEEYLHMHPDVEFDVEHDAFILSVDLAEGLGQDYSTIQILRVGYDNDEYFYEQVGTFACNTIPLDDFAVITSELFNALNPDYSRLLVEQNTYGDYFFKCLQDDEKCKEIPYESICKFKRSSDSEHKTKGLRTNKQTKKIGVSSFKYLVDNDQLIIHDENTIGEIENFQENKRGNFEATIGHDDLVTPLVNFSYFVNLAENDYKFWLEEYAELNGFDVYDIDDEENIDINSLPEYVKEFL